MQSDDRAYFSRRSVEEIRAAMRADSLEATNAHIGLAELHLRECARCVGSASEECDHCLAVNICARRGSVRARIVPAGSSNGDDRPRPAIRQKKVIAGDMAAFSQQERQILQHIARGLSAREVGEVIGTAARKVERQVDAMRAKLNARNAAHLITRAIVGGILTLPV